MFSKILSDRQYNIAIGLLLLWGFAINAIMCIFFPNMFMSMNPVVFIVGYFVAAVAGISMSKFSRNPVVSFIGYNLVVLPMGAMLSLALPDYLGSTIIRTLIATIFITLLMIGVSIIKPQLFNSLGIPLFICLIGVLIVELISMFMWATLPKWWDWLVAILFCGYIGYDWGKAQEKPKTLDNAVDSVVELYLDIVNLFLRLLPSGDND